MLIRSENRFYMRMYRGPYLDLTDGTTVENPPNLTNVATWSSFKIYVPQPGLRPPGAEVYRWPPTAKS